MGTGHLESVWPTYIQTCELLTDSQILTSCRDCIKASRAKLDQRVASFLAVTTDEEKELLSRNHDEFERLVAAASQARKQRDLDAIAAGPSVAGRLKQGWSAISAVAYEYVKILDVMVGQAPEYVGPVYGAISIWTRFS